MTTDKRGNQTITGHEVQRPLLNQHQSLVSKRSTAGTVVGQSQLRLLRWRSIGDMLQALGLRKYASQMEKAELDDIKDLAALLQRDLTGGTLIGMLVKAGIKAGSATKIANSFFEEGRPL